MNPEKTRSQEAECRKNAAEEAKKREYNAWLKFRKLFKDTKTWH